MCGCTPMFELYTIRYVRIHAHNRVYMCTRTHTTTYIACIQLCMPTSVSIVGTHVCVCMFVYTHAHMYAYVHTCTIPYVHLLRQKRADDRRAAQLTLYNAKFKMRLAFERSTTPNQSYMRRETLSTEHSRWRSRWVDVRLFCHYMSLFGRYFSHAVDVRCCWL